METMIYGCDWCNKELRQNSFPAGWKRFRTDAGEEFVAFETELEELPA